MDDRRFDALTKRLGAGGSRRTLLKTLIGLGGVATTGRFLYDADAARRGYPGPPTLGPSPTQTAQPTTVPTQTAQPIPSPTKPATTVSTQTPTASPTQTTVPPTQTPTVIPSTCTSDDDCRAIHPTYCDSNAHDPLLWRYHLCNSGFCFATAHVCDNPSKDNCEIDVCDDVTGCALASVQPGQIGSEEAVCCTENSHCADLQPYCDGGDWHYYVCFARRCSETVQRCGAGQCREPIGCEILAPG